MFRRAPPEAPIKINKKKQSFYDCHYCEVAHKVQEIPVIVSCWQQKLGSTALCFFCQQYLLTLEGVTDLKGGRSARVGL